MKMKLNEVGWDVALGPLDLQSNEALRENDYVLVHSRMTSLFLYSLSVYNIWTNE